MGDAMVAFVAVVVFLAFWGWALLVRKPPIEPVPSPEFEQRLAALAAATEAVAQQLGRALLPAFQAVAAAASSVIEAFAHHGPQPSDPNPMPPRFHLFRRSL